MAKIGYAPKWGDIHTKAFQEFEKRKDDPKFVSPKFDNVDDALEWLDA